MHVNINYDKPPIILYFIDLFTQFFFHGILEHAEHLYYPVAIRFTNRPFYSCLLGDLAFEWQRGWS